jgi:ABC-type Fe3+-siderophore transport system permease subunit
MDLTRTLLVYLALLAGAGALISGEIALVGIMYPVPALELAQVSP